MHVKIRAPVPSDSLVKTGLVYLAAAFQLLLWNTYYVVQTYPPLGIYICTRSQEDADGLGMASLGSRDNSRVALRKTTCNVR